MRTHLNRCPARGRAFADIHPGRLRGYHCVCFAGQPAPVTIDPSVDWARNVNVYVTHVTRRVGREVPAELKAHDSGSVPGSSYFGRRRALEVLVRDEPSTMLWVTNDIDRARVLGARHPATLSALETRNAGLPRRQRDGSFPKVSAARGGIRYVTHTPEGGLPPGHHVARIRDASVDPVTGVTEVVLDATAASRHNEVVEAFFPTLASSNPVREAAALIASGGWCAPTEVAASLGLVPPKPKADPDDFEWRKTTSAERTSYGKCHVMSRMKDPDIPVALCTAANGDPTRVGEVDADKLVHEGRCRRCLHYINASGGAVPPSWPTKTDIEPLKKEIAMGHIDRATRLREEAERMLNQAAELENRPSEPEPDDEGNAIVWIRVTFREGDTRHYDYAAMRAENGAWYSTGAERAGNGSTWERLIDHFYDNCATVEVWQAVEFFSIGAKK